MDHIAEAGRPPAVAERSTGELVKQMAEQVSVLVRDELSGETSTRLMPSPMLNCRMSGPWLLALVLTMVRDRLVAPWSR
jgi:hypothetical protein